jgi:hypothetical protein
MPAINIRLPRAIQKLPFADDGSRANALLALRPDRPSCFVVSANRPGLGKSFFVRYCLEQFDPSPKVTRWPRTAEEMAKEIFEACYFHGYLWFDDVGRIKPSVLYPLNAALTALVVSHRFPGTQRKMTVPNCLIIFISGNRLAPNADMLRFARLINLSQP